MIVIAVIAMLATIAIPKYLTSIKASKEAVLKEDLHVLRQQIDAYTNDKEKAPQSLDDLVSAGYMKSIPVDPMTHSNTTWVTTTDDSVQSLTRPTPASATSIAAPRSRAATAGLIPSGSGANASGGDRKGCQAPAADASSPAALISAHTSLSPRLVSAEQSSIRSMPRPSRNAFSALKRAFPESRSAFVPTTRNRRPTLVKNSINCASAGCTGMLLSTRQMHSARVSRFVRYGSMNLGHSAEIDFEILA